jgi:predicted Fe-Mo cluster-binding NifX family protein
MKIAVVTDDGKSISQHFGRAAYYMVVTVENGVISGHEMREKIGHAQFHQQEEHHHDEKQNEPHGFGTEADHRHGRMAETIMDCEAVLCRGMGKGAYENMKARNIRPVVTDIIEIDDAVRSYAEGQIVDHVDKLH